MRVAHSQYEGNTQYMGNGLTKFCMKCQEHRAYVPGGVYLGPKGMKYWVCPRHVKLPVREK